SVLALGLRALPRSPPFPYTTLFRSGSVKASGPGTPTKTREPGGRGMKPQFFFWLAGSMAAFLSAATASRAYVSGNNVSLLILSRSEEHTSELQSRENLVCRLLLEKK